MPFGLQLGSSGSRSIFRSDSGLAGKPKGCVDAEPDRQPVLLQGGVISALLLALRNVGVQPINYAAR